ncbi:hypothetical protein PGB90_003882 [Kerria lacca]
MIVKLIILFGILPLCVPVTIRINPVKIIEYKKSTSSASTNGNFTNITYISSEDEEHNNGIITQEESEYVEEKDITEYSYDYSFENYQDYEITSEEYTTEEDKGKTSIDDYNKRNKPVIMEDGKVIVNRFNSQMSKNSTSVIPLYGTSTSYSGYFLVNEQFGAHLFFWFFLSDTNAANAPLIVWLQGQPDSSVLIGFFKEHGPYFLDHDGILRKRDYAWCREFNVLYIDHCIPCGFSYANFENGSTTDIGSSSDYVYEALTQFYEIFEEFADNDLYLAGEYGCSKIIPIICETIHSQNKNKKKMNLKGAIIGSGLFNINVMVNYGKFWLHSGLADINIMRNIGYLEETIRGYIRSDFEEDVLNYFRNYIFVKLSERDFNSAFDIRYVNASMNDKFQYLVAEPLFRKWIHVGNRTYYEGHSYLSLQMLKETKDYVPELLQHYKMLYYNGQFDTLFPYYHTSKYLETLGWLGLEDWYQSTRKKWYVHDRLIGYTKKHKTLTQVLVRNAGHMVGQTQPQSLFYLVKWFINDLFT